MPSPAPGWHLPAVSASSASGQLYQTGAHVLTYAVYAGVLLLLVGLLSWPRTELAERGGHQTHGERALHYKRLGNVSEPCRLLLAGSADAFADFMACTVKASRPLAVCTRCVHNRYPLEQAFERILSGTSASDADCRLELLEQDDVHVVAYHLQYYQLVMAQNGCDRCVARLGFGGYRVTDAVTELARRHDAFRACVQRNANRTRWDGTPAVCSQCADPLRQQAQQLEAVSGRGMHPAGAICADVEDMVNVTSRMWRCAGCRAPTPPPGIGDWAAHAPALAAALLAALFCAAVDGRRRRAAAAGASAERRVAGEQQQQRYHRPLRAGERLRPPGVGETFARLVRELEPEVVRPPPLPADHVRSSSCALL